MNLYEFTGLFRIEKEGETEIVPFTVRSAGENVNEAWDAYWKSLSNYDNMYLTKLEHKLIEGEEETQ